MRGSSPGGFRFRFALAVGTVFGCVLLATRPVHAPDASDPPLTIFHADSLTPYVELLAHEFEAAHPGVQVHHEGAGSLDTIRKVTDLHMPCDIVITADWRLLNEPRPGLEPWVAIFAGNAMGLLYTDRSPGASELNATNWFDVLQHHGVRYGHSNPERDPAGYWTLIVWQLAERYYQRPGLAAKLAAGCPPANIRPHNIDLVALLESGDLDYYFGYASDVKLGRLKFLGLPPEINLGDPADASHYAEARIEVGDMATRRTIVGAPIAYGATLVADAPDRAVAIEFLALMLSETGKRVAEQCGLVAYPGPLRSDPRGTMPPELLKLTRPN
jgi:molybdate/tungstate transport system substrate-binding protein